MNAEMCGFSWTFTQMCSVSNEQCLQQIWNILNDLLGWAMGKILFFKQKSILMKNTLNQWEITNFQMVSIQIWPINCSTEAISHWRRKIEMKINDLMGNRTKEWNRTKPFRFEIYSTIGIKRTRAFNRNEWIFVLFI